MAIIVGLIYLVFSAALLYAILFVGNLGAPRTIDLGPAGSPYQAWVIDGALLALFALLPVARMKVHPSVPGGRSAAGRSAHARALLAGLALTAFFIAWHPLPQIIWSWSGAPASILRGLFYLGWTLVLISALIHHGRPFAALGATASRAWGVGEPMYPGLMLALWAAPSMTAGHLLLAAAATAYVLAAALLAERGGSSIARVSPPLAGAFASHRGASSPERR